MLSETGRAKHQPAASATGEGEGKPVWQKYARGIPCQTNNLRNSLL